MTETVLKWAWRYSVLGVDIYDSLDDAVRAAMWASDAGEEALDCIEVVRIDGTREVLGRDAVYELQRPIEEEREKEYKARPTPTVVLSVQGPSGKWATYSSYVERDKADGDADRFRQALGPDRVKLTPYGSRRVS